MGTRLLKKQDLKIQRPLGIRGLNTLLTRHDPDGPLVINHLQFLLVGDLRCELPKGRSGLPGSQLDPRSSAWHVAHAQ